MKPIVTSVVVYKLSDQDAVLINNRRDDASAFRRNITGPVKSGEHGRTGHVEHTGNRVSEGDEYPAIVVRKFHPDTATVNLQVLLDGNDTCWATSRMQGEGPGQWSWPEQPEREPGDRPATY